MSYLKEKISPVYQNWLPTEVLNLEFPTERFTPCLQCHHETVDNNYRRHTKCCDYHPVYPNYVIGAILCDEDPNIVEGKRRFKQKIQEKIGVTPYGIYPSRDYNKKFQASRKRNRTISQSEINAIACPYMTADRLCSVWKYRSELCATYHCISSNGNSGNRFWTLMRTYLTNIERKLALYALGQLDYPLKAIQTHPLGRNPFQPKEQATNEQRTKIYQNTWRNWKDKEEAFYIACFAAVNELTPDQTQSILGIEEQILFEQLQDQARKMYEAMIPDRLQLNEQYPQINNLLSNQPIRLKNGRIFQLKNPQALLLKKFKRGAATLPVLQQGVLMKIGMSAVVSTLVEEGILEE